MENILLKKVSSSVWRRDNTNNTIYAEINGVKVIEIDSRGNLIIKGRVLTRK